MVSEHFFLPFSLFVDVIWVKVHIYSTYNNLVVKKWHEVRDRILMENVIGVIIKMQS